MAARAETSSGGNFWRLWALGPILLLAVVVGAFVTSGSTLVDLIGRNPPPADVFDVRRVEFKPGEIRIRVTNPQAEPITIASVTVDDAIVPFTVDGANEVKRLRSSTIVVPFDWVPDDPINVGVTSSTGIESTKEIAAAVETPTASAKGFLGYGLIGFLVGVVPVALGLLWLPSLRRARPEWLAAFMALTAGLLTFLGVEALFEAFDRQALLPQGMGGAGLVLLGVALSYLGMTFLSSRLRSGGREAGGMVLAVLTSIALIVLAFYARIFALTVQDRVIRLEMRMRLKELLPAALQPRIREFTRGQLVALRFASDAELPELAEKVLRDKIQDRAAIKQMVRDWEADHLRV